MWSQLLLTFTLPISVFAADIQPRQWGAFSIPQSSKQYTSTTMSSSTLSPPSPLSSSSAGLSATSGTTIVTSASGSTGLKNFTTSISGAIATVVTPTSFAPSSISSTLITTDASGNPTTIVTAVPTSPMPFVTVVTTVSGILTTMTTPVSDSSSDTGTSFDTFTSGVSGLPTTVVTSAPNTTSSISTTTDDDSQPATNDTSPVTATSTTDVEESHTTLVTALPTDTSQTTIPTSSSNELSTTGNTIIPPSLPSGVTSVLTKAPPGFSTDHATNVAWTSNTWITTSHDNQPTVVPVLVGCPACGGIGAGIIIWGIPAVPDVSFQIPSFPDLPSFHLPCIPTSGVLNSVCTTDPEYDNGGRPGAPGTNPTPGITSESLTKDTSSTSSTSSSESEAGACTAGLPLVPTSGPLSISIPDDGSESSNDDARYEKRAIAGRVTHTVALHKRAAAKTIKAINGCTLTTSKLGPVTYPSYPGGKNFFESDLANNLAAQYSTISRYYVATVHSSCLPTVTQVPASQVQLRVEPQNNGEMSIDHAYEKAWLDNFMKSIVGVQGNVDMLSCEDANKVFFNHACGRNYLQEIYGALASEDNLDFVAMSQYLNGNCKNLVVGLPFQALGSRISDVQVDSKDPWSKARGILDDKFKVLGSLILGCLTVQEPIVLELIQRTNNRIYYHLQQLDTYMSSPDDNLPRQEFGIAERYKTFMNAKATVWNDRPNLVLKAIESIRKDLETATELTLKDEENEDLEDFQGRWRAYNQAYTVNNNPAYFQITFDWRASATKRDLIRAALRARQAGTCSLSSTSSSAASSSVTAVESSTPSTSSQLETISPSQVLPSSTAIPTPIAPSPSPTPIVSTPSPATTPFPCFLAARNFGDTVPDEPVHFADRIERRAALLCLTGHFQCCL